MNFKRSSIHVWSRLGLFLFIIMALQLTLPGTALAQAASQQLQQSEPISLDSVNVDIWPEYDRPSVLVIMHMKVSPQVKFPADISIRIPASAGKPYAVAWQSPDKALFDLKYETKAAGDWTEIRFNAPSPDIQIEYYDPTIMKTGPRRDFTYHWSEKYPVQNLSLQIQQPVNATNMTFRPDVGSGSTGDSGLTYYSLQVGKVNPETTFDLAMSYNKPDDMLTNPQQFQQAKPNQPVDSGASGRITFDQFLPWGLGGLGLLLITVGFLWYWRTGRIFPGKVTYNRPRHNPARSNRATEPNSGPEEASFCHQCGKKAGPGDVFCRVCGTKLR
jgi:hypothetical protein